MSLAWLLAATPILLVVVLMTVVRWPATRAGLLDLLAAMALAVAAFVAGWDVQRAALARGLLMALDVLPIVWGAYLFYRVTAESGAIDALGEELAAVTPSRGLQSLVIGWAFASFLQRDRQDFEEWYRASKYCQVVIPCAQWEEIAWDGFQAALRIAADRRKQEEPVAWMVGNDPMTAAVYNKGEKAKAFDAARRWNDSITGLSIFQGAPDLRDKEQP